MSAAALTLDIIFLLGLTWYLLRKYGKPRASWAVTIATFVAWFFSFSIVLILPLDISSTFYWDCVRTWYCDTTPTNSTAYQACSDEVFTDCHCEEPWSYVSQETLPSFWKVVFWLSQALTWLVLPLMESYISAGEFTVWGRIKASLKENAVIYGSAGALLAAFFIYIAARNRLGPSQLEQVVIAASNTWGLVFLIIMLGYGLVDVPRFLWRRANYELTMRLYQFRAAQLHGELSDSKDELDQVIEEVRNMAGRLGRADPLRPYLNQILTKCPMEFDVESGIDDYKDFNGGKSASDFAEVTRAQLAKLHKRLITAIRVHRRSECQWEYLMEKAFELDDVIKNSGSADHVFKPSFGRTYIGRFRNITPVVEWYWKCAIQPWVFYILAVVATGMSLALVWSEVLFSTENPTLSIYAHLMDAVGNGGNYFPLEMMTFFTLFYTSICAYRVIFQLRVLNYYYLVPRQQTDGSSLLFSAMFLSRLTTPLCLNFLSLAHLDNHVTTSIVYQPTAFTQISGHMDVVAFIGNFSTYYPMLVLLISLCTLLRVGARILSFFGVQRFINEDSGAEEYVTEGKALITRERRRRERTNNPEFGGGLGSSTARRARGRYSLERVSATGGPGEAAGRRTIDLPDDASLTLVNGDGDAPARIDRAPPRARDSLRPSLSRGNSQTSIADFEEFRRMDNAEPLARGGAGAVGAAAPASGSGLLGGRLSKWFSGSSASGASTSIAEDTETLLPSQRIPRAARSSASGRGSGRSSRPKRNLFDDI